MDTRESIDIYQASIHSIAKVFLALGRAGRLELAEAVLLDERRIGGVERMSYAEFAGGAALVAGEAGIHTLAVVAESGSYKSWSSYAIDSLWLAASGKQIPHEGYAAAVSDIRFPVNETVRIRAREILDEIIVASKENLGLFSKIMTLASNEANKNQVMGGVNEFAEHVMKIFAAGSITVPASVLEDFESLVSKNLPEEKYQEFLKSAPTCWTHLRRKSFRSIDSVTTTSQTLSFGATTGGISWWKSRSRRIGYLPRGTTSLRNSRTRWGRCWIFRVGLRSARITRAAICPTLRIHGDFLSWAVGRP